MENPVTPKIQITATDSKSNLIKLAKFLLLFLYNFNFF
jgi:hypothetical protein